MNYLLPSNVLVQRDENMAFPFWYPVSISLFGRSVRNAARMGDNASRMKRVDELWMRSEEPGQ